MKFKTILAVVASTDALADTEAAIQICAESGAHLSVLIIGASISAIGADYAVSPAWIEQREIEVNAQIATRKNVEELCRKNAISFDVEHLYDELFVLESYVCTRAMYADVVLVGKGVRADHDLRRTVIAASSFDAKTPVLLRADPGSVRLTPKTVLIAWNSRPEAARAVKEALPFVVKADRVNIVLVDPVNRYMRNGGQPGADIATFLTRHGANVVVEQLPSGGRPAEEVLRQHALEIGAELIVLGAYGHSRLRERVFGGVTASFLSQSEFPVFLAR